MSGADDLDHAKADVAAAHGRLAATVAEIEQRISPRVLLREARGYLRDRGDEAAGGAIDLVRNRPAATAGVVAAVALVALRNPIGRAVAKLFFSERETEPADDKLNAVNASPKPARTRRRSVASDKGD